jgi:hypothetical protein
MDLTVKNIPESVYRVIRREAKRNRRSLNSQILHTLEAEAQEAERVRHLKNLRKALDDFAASVGPVDDSTPLIRRDRER